MTPKLLTEDAFLDDRVGKPTSIFLINGLHLRGTLVGFDSDVLFLRPHDTEDGALQMISKQAIATTVPTLLRRPARVTA